jgi:hypothetical protein
MSGFLAGGLASLRSLLTGLASTFPRATFVPFIPGVEVIEKTATASERVGQRDNQSDLTD